MIEQYEAKELSLIRKICLIQFKMRKAGFKDICIKDTLFLNTRYEKFKFRYNEKFASYEISADSLLRFTADDIVNFFLKEFEWG